MRKYINDMFNERFDLGCVEASVGNFVTLSNIYVIFLQLSIIFLGFNSLSHHYKDHSDRLLWPRRSV